ncbi:hypothetical protein [Accumulibacter sp.]|uniref:hypothetical protein n=1 Tax=Candidatus Accumulibacter TaxID=327159 RepID=UPI00190053A7|nr:hypothetical protein [Accumulibacter sp.]MBN8499435.1 hypothetical protein [Accumulibacter sp.]MBO3715560.1 hypothetical protein [Accumulibacter sp.]
MDEEVEVAAGAVLTGFQLALEFQQAVGERELEARMAALRKADFALSRLRLYLRLAHQWRWLNTGQYEHVSGLVAEIGRLLGGWLKQTAK